MTAARRVHTRLHIHHSSLKTIASVLYSEMKGVSNDIWKMIWVFETRSRVPPIHGDIRLLDGRGRRLQSASPLKHECKFGSRKGGHGRVVPECRADPHHYPADAWQMNAAK